MARGAERPRQGLGGDPTYLIVREDSTLESFGGRERDEGWNGMAGAGWAGVMRELGRGQVTRVGTKSGGRAAF